MKSPDRARGIPSPEGEPAPRLPLRAVRCGLAATAILLSAITTLAHGDLDLRLEAVTQQIKRSPARAPLYLQRAELRRAHAEPELALADLAKARELEATLAGLDFAEGRILMELERWAEARSAFDRALKADPDHPMVLWFRARTLVLLGHRAGADADFERCLEVVPQPTPELYLARTANLEQAGRTNDALAVLEQGVGRLGDVSSLQLAAIELLARAGRPAAALAKLDRLIAAAVRKESLLLRKGALLEAMGDRAAARECYLAAKKDLDSLPPSTGNTVANRALAEKIGSALNRVTPVSTNAGRP